MVKAVLILLIVISNGFLWHFYGKAITYEKKINTLNQKINLTKKDNKDLILGKIGEHQISMEDLIGSDALMFYDLESQMFEFKKGRFRKIVMDYYLSTKSNELKISKNDFIRNHLIKNQNTTPSEKEIEDFIKTQNLGNIDEIKKHSNTYDRIIEFIRMKKEFDIIQVYVNNWAKVNTVEYYFNRPIIPIKIPENTSPAWGPVGAKVVITKFSDFECPFCAKSGKTLLNIKKKYGDKIRVVYKHFPLDMHKNAKNAALTSICIQEQKPIAFWEFYEDSLNLYNNLEKDTLYKLVKNSKVNLEEFKNCMERPTTEALLNLDIELGNRIGLQSTPVFFINGEMIKGNVSQEHFEEVIDYYLNKEDL